MYVEIEAIMKDLMTGANTKDKFPDEADNISFTLFGTDNRICAGPDGPTDCRNVRSPRKSARTYLCLIQTDSSYSASHASAKSGIGGFLQRLRQFANSRLLPSLLRGLQFQRRLQKPLHVPVAREQAVFHGLIPVLIRTARIDCHLSSVIPCVCRCLMQRHTMVWSNARCRDYVQIN